MTSPGKQRDPFQSPFTRRERFISTGVAVIIGIVVMAVTKNVLWGMVTFLVMGVAINVALLSRKKGRLQ